VDYAVESRKLDAEILTVVAAWNERGTELSDAEFNDLALRVFAQQLRYNMLYWHYSLSFGVTPLSLPASWEAIPPMPAAAFKQATLTTFDFRDAKLTFATSGTTQGNTGHHYMETGDLYDASLLAGFDHFMLPDRAALQYFMLVPDPRENERSSLGYMMARVAERRGTGTAGWYLRGDELLVDAFVADLQAAIAKEIPVCIAGTAFAYVNLCDALRERAGRFVLPAGSRLMETGGFKGRTRIVEPRQLYAELADTFGIAQDRIVAEYGMTELTSQYYEDVLLRERGDPRETRLKKAPPWLRTRAVGPDGKTLPHGVVGALVHVDIANRASCVAILTEDLGATTADGLILLGRERGAALRGCSLDAEELRRA
jgi:hypothetical protein